MEAPSDFCGRIGVDFPLNVVKVPLSIRALLFNGKCLSNIALWWGRQLKKQERNSVSKRGKIVNPSKCVVHDLVTSWRSTGNRQKRRTTKTTTTTRRKKRVTRCRRRTVVVSFSVSFWSPLFSSFGLWHVSFSATTPMDHRLRPLFCATTLKKEKKKR